MLSPVMSSMLSVFHVGSATHEIVQAPPGWKVSPGPGVIGVSAAKAAKAKDKTKVEKALRDNIGDERRESVGRTKIKKQRNFFFFRG
jgi:hypothetical protein